MVEAILNNNDLIGITNGGGSVPTTCIKGGGRGSYFPTIDNRDRIPSLSGPTLY